MTTTELTTRERVQQAVTRQFELLAEKDEAGYKASEATSNLNVLKNSSVVEGVRASEGAVYNNASGRAANTYQVAVAKAHEPLDAAQAVFDSAETKIREKREEALQHAEDAFYSKLNAAQDAYTMEMTTAEAEVHRAKSEVQALENTMSQHRDLIKGQLGIDLATLTQAVE